MTVLLTLVTTRNGAKRFQKKSFHSFEGCGAILLPLTLSMSGSELNGGAGCSRTGTSAGIRCIRASKFTANMRFCLQHYSCFQL